MVTTTSIDPIRRAALVRRRRSTAATGWLYAAPTAAVVVGLFVVPLVLVLQMSASRWPLFAGYQGINFPRNFVRAVTSPRFGSAVVFTIEYTVIATVLLLALGLGLALLVQESTRWKGLLRTAILVPSALGLASASLLFYALYSPIVGPFAGLTRSLGIDLLGTPTSALWSTVFLIVWRFSGFYMLLMLVGLQGIPEELYEAARTDGASTWQVFTSITLPLLKPTIALTSVLCITGSLLAFDQFYILTKGGPDNSTLTVVQLVYNSAFQGQNDLGVAGALSVIVLIALVLINAAQLRAFRDPKEK